ncbi:hypothetical protein CEXT_455511 [Caerostris extrusa]|uniref:Uncharacterized protein n=1 Tax=Caerostris extrusa TaxID=172846 RepID=A0AAV4UD00_CAEEX|nr:hypothetical protein CEXT_455511 [Caerostris extrusa]
MVSNLGNVMLVAVSQSLEVKWSVKRGHRSYWSASEHCYGSSIWIYLNKNGWLSTKVNKGFRQPILSPLKHSMPNVYAHTHICTHIPFYHLIVLEKDNWGGVGVKRMK